MKIHRQRSSGIWLSHEVGGMCWGTQWNVFDGALRSVCTGQDRLAWKQTTSSEPSEEEWVQIRGSVEAATVEAEQV